MQTGDVMTLIQTIGDNRWGAIGLVLLLMLESLPVIGLFLPGVFLMVALGSLSGTDYLSFADCVVFASMGALLGDSTGYWLGRSGVAPGLLGAGWARNRHSRDRAGTLLERYGRRAVFLGRFVWFFHPAVPVIAGATGIRPHWFYLADVPAVILWVLLYAGIGHWATGVARARTLEFSLIAGSLVALAFLYYLFRYLRHRSGEGTP